jgi:hypothetical protein
MTQTTSHLARATLRRLTTPHALAFGTRLLSRGTDGTITFREFLAVARELVTLLPEQSAVYLAALVALDMSNDDSVLAERQQPSPN